MVHDGIHYDTLPEEGHDPLIHTVNNTVSEEIGKIIKNLQSLNWITASLYKVHWHASSNPLPVPRVLPLQASS